MPPRKRYPDETPQIYTGAAYDPHRPLPQTARLLQADLRQAVRAGTLPRDHYRVMVRHRGWFEETKGTLVVVSWYSWTPICNEISALASRYNQVPWGGWTHLRLAGGDHALPQFALDMALPLPRPFRADHLPTAAARYLTWEKAFDAQRECATGIRSDQWDWYVDMLAFEYSQWIQALAAERPVVRGIDWEEHLPAWHTTGQLHWVPACLGDTASCRKICDRFSGSGKPINDDTRCAGA